MLKMKKIHYLLLPFILFFLLFFSCTPANKGIYNVLDYGAKGDSSTLNTVAINRVIEEAAKRGGGKIIIPAPGVYLSGTIHLLDNITLEIEAGAILLGSPNIADYDSITQGHNIDRQPYHLIYANGAKNITLQGKGIIDGNGEAFWQEYEKDEQGNMVVPRWILAKEKKISPLIELQNATNVFIEDLTIKTGGGWNVHIFDCDLVKIDGVRIINSLFSPNSDGIDISGGQDVTISNCFIRTCDDGVCVKSLPNSRPTRRVTVTNCIIQTSCVALKLGYAESFQDMSEITFSNCVIDKSSRAIGLYVGEGAVCENITISNIAANTNAPFVLNRPIQIMVEQKSAKSKPGTIRNVLISNFTCTTEGRILLTAEAGNTLENVVLRDIHIGYAYIEDPSNYTEGVESAQFPKKNKHPEARSAQGVVVADNVQNLVIDNLMITYPKDSIPAAWKYLERIENGGKRIFRLPYDKLKDTELSAVWANNVKGGYIYAPLAASSDKALPKYKITNSTIQIKD
jgi:hypothetical protein